MRLKAMILHSNLEEFEGISRFCVARTKDFYRSDPFLCLRTDLDPVRNADIRAERLSPAEVVEVARLSKRFEPVNADDRTDPKARRATRQDYLLRCAPARREFLGELRRPFAPLRLPLPPVLRL